jgi:hypothetical protein
MHAITHASSGYKSQKKDRAKGGAKKEKEGKKDPMEKKNSRGGT